MAESAHHTITIEPDDTLGLRPSFGCTAPTGSECRLYCKHEECAESETGCHHQGEPGHEREDVGYCLPIEWLNNTDSVEYDGRGSVTVPIAVNWNGDNYDWTLKPEKDFRRRLAALAEDDEAVEDLARQWGDRVLLDRNATSWDRLSELNKSLWRQEVVTALRAVATHEAVSVDA